MTRVLQVLGALVLGGAESRVMDIYRSIDRSKYDFDFVTMKPGPQYYEQEIVERGGGIHKIGFPRDVGMLRHISELRQCIRDGHYDAVHAHTSYHCGIVMLAAWLERVPVRITHARTTGSRQRGIKRRVAESTGRMLIGTFSTRRIAISKLAGDYLFGRRSYEVIPNAIDVPKYQSCNETDLTQYRNELRIPNGWVVIGHIGRFDDMKNHRFILECFRSFKEGNPNSVLLLVGDGELRELTQRYAAGLGLDADVRFLGERSDAPKLMHLFDVLLFPSKFEGLGGVAIEAQAAGVPVVESDAVPIETDLGVGLVKRHSLSEDLSLWVGSIEECLKQAKVGYETINEALEAKGYNLEKVTKRYQKIYEGAP